MVLVYIDIITLDNDDMDILYIYYPYDGSYINANIDHH